MSDVEKLIENLKQMEERHKELAKMECNEVFQLQDAIKTIKALSAKLSASNLNGGWHVVADGDLPEQPNDRVDENGVHWFTPYGEYIVCDEKSNVFVASYTYIEKRFWYMKSLNTIYPIAWMPLPIAWKGNK